MQQKSTSKIITTSLENVLEFFLLTDQDGEASGGPEYAELPGLVEHNFEGYLAHSFSRHGQNNVVKTSRSSESLVVNVGQGNDTVSGKCVSVTCLVQCVDWLFHPKFINELFSQTARM